MIVEILTRIINRFGMILYAMFNWQTLKNAKLHGIPKLINRPGIIIEKNVSINDNVLINGRGGVTIKEDSVLSYGVTILSTELDTTIWMKERNRNIHLDDQIIIGRNVWLCANVTVLSGVSIADDIIVGAGSIVTKNLEESGWIYAGSPAKKIKRIG